MDAQTEQQGPAGEPKPEPEEARFTQADLDRIIDERLKRAESSKAKAIADALAEERNKQRIASLEGEERIKALYEEEIAKAKKDQEERDRELAETKRILAMTKAESKLISLGLPPELAGNVIGEDDKATEKNIAALSKSVSDLVAKQVKEGMHHGAPKAGGSASTASEVRAEVFANMGIKE